ncbi:MAG: serine protease [Patescibacteria group bacterium]
MSDVSPELNQVPQNKDKIQSGKNADKSVRSRLKKVAGKVILATPIAGLLVSSGSIDNPNVNAPNIKDPTPAPAPLPDVTSQSVDILQPYTPQPHAETPALSVTPIHAPELTPTPRQLPDAATVSDSLKQIRTNLEATGEQSYFIEKAGYTKEMFESVRRGTFMVEMTGEREIQGRKEIIVARGTAWLALAESNTYYFVTNRHVTQLLEGVKMMGAKLWRPNLDTEMFIPTGVSIAASGDPHAPDIAVLALKGDYHTTNPVKAIKWEDNVLLQKGDNVLIVGFPGEFKDEKKELGSYTHASITTIEENANPQTGAWFARALVNIGSSGSPVVVNKDGQEVAVGIVFGRNDLVLKNNDTETQKQPVVTGASLNIGYLINALKAKN